ncbi:unnamed protein product [Pleuronectes platessa]|uniref:Uncharacterized protein n=1 Tax=Pleuronectes platessa TaxID=8262 RepID=A0A9N7VMK9_PLEPL|nr:unnamed protein product [Pleuronectes platessa]
MNLKLLPSTVVSILPLIPSSNYCCSRSPLLPTPPSLRGKQAVVVTSPLAMCSYPAGALRDYSTIDPPPQHTHSTHPPPIPHTALTSAKGSTLAATASNMAADGSLPFADISDVLDDGHVGSSQAVKWKEILEKSRKPGGVKAQWLSDKGPVISSSGSGGGIRLPVQRRPGLALAAACDLGATRSAPPLKELGVAHFLEGVAGEVHSQVNIGETLYMQGLCDGSAAGSLASSAWDGTHE